MKPLDLSLSFKVVMMILVLTLIVWASQEGVKTLRPSELPAAVAETIKSNCQSCVIAKATREVENGVTIYDIEFKNGQGQMALVEDGSIIDRKTVVQLTDVPAPALEAIRKGAAGGQIRQIAKYEILLELKNGNVIKLDSPKYLYEAELVKGNQLGEIQVTPEGQVTEGPTWKK